MSRAVALAVLLIAGALAIARLVPGSGSRLNHAAAGWVAAEVFVELGAIVAYVLQFHDAFSAPEHPLSLVRSAEVAVGELGAFLVVPTGAGGPALRVWALLRSGFAAPVLMRRIVIQTVIFNLPYLATALVLGTTVALGVGPGHAPLEVALAPLGVAAVAVGLVGLITAFAGGRRRAPSAGWRRLGWQAIQAVPDGLRELPAGLRQPILVIGAFLYWAGDCAVLVLAFHAAHGSVSLAVILPAYMLGQLGNALPLPGGVGGVEPIMLGVLTASGINAGLGGAAIVLYRFVSLGLQTAGGTIAVAFLLRTLGPRRTATLSD